MRQAIVLNRQDIVPALRRRIQVPRPEPAIRLPQRGEAGPIHVSALVSPILEISRHPDRNRLLAELFNQ